MFPHTLRLPGRLGSAVDPGLDGRSPLRAALVAVTTLAVITGTSRGIGAGIAAAAANAGAAVAVCNRTATGHDTELVADLSQPSAWAEVASWYDDLVAAQAPDRVLFIHNSATLTPIGFAGDVDAAAYERLVLLDSAAPQVLGDAVIRTAHRHTTPTVVMQLSSGAASNPFPGWSGYCAAKAAVEMWVRSVAAERGGTDDGDSDGERDGLVRVAAIRPGVVDTGMQAEIRSSDASDFPGVERFHQLHETGALRHPDEVGAMVWEASVAESWANGAILDVNEPTW